MDRSISLPTPIFQGASFLDIAFEASATMVGK
jgi:hypothetical protein